MRIEEARVTRSGSRPLRLARRCGLLGLLSLVALPTNATTVEEIFAAARNYTVYIETRIETPFIEDDAGSYLGAGFIVDRQRGWVMTNAHVIGHSPATLDVSFSDGAKSKATPVYIDSFLDLALIQLEPNTTVARDQARLDCADHPAVGVPVGAYGHPNGYRFTGTRGIVSGFSSLAGSASLQTDAPINGGNSGGPLIRLDTGTVVGINTQSLVGDHVQNMNFAVETVYACRVLELLQQEEDPRPAALDALFYMEDGEPTLTISHIGRRAVSSSLAESAGLVPFDQLIGVNGRPVDDVDQLASIALGSSADTAEIDVIRLAPHRDRFTRHVRATMPLDHATWVALRPSEVRAPNGSEPSHSDASEGMDFASINQPIR